MIDIFGFCRVWILDLIFYPFRFFKNLKLRHQNILRFRDRVESQVIYVCVHEWGGYTLVRQKNIKNIKTFTCGLKYQLERFGNERSKYPIDLTITMSEPEKYSDFSLIKRSCDNFIPVSNVGMDFSGYWSFYNTIKYKKNAYVILTNSSVECYIHDFIGDYINYMEENKDVGILGISSSSKYYHTLVRNNFNPHLQSFFLLTTIDTLKNIIEANGGTFPGINEKNKHLLIRNGEVKISRLALELGYNLAVVGENGEVTKFNYNSYPLVRGDLRLTKEYPNRIYPIKKQ